MPGYQGKYILLRFYRRKISAICCFLKTDKLQHPYPFPIHPLPHTRKFQNIRVCKVRFNGTGSIYCLADITEQKRCSFRLFRQPALRKTRQGGCRKFFCKPRQTLPAFSSSDTTVKASSQNRGSGSPSASKASGKVRRE